MSIYPGEKPYYGTITVREYQQLQLVPELLKAFKIANEVIKNEYPEEQWADYNVPVNEFLIKRIEEVQDVNSSPGSSV